MNGYSKDMRVVISNLDVFRRQRNLVAAIFLDLLDATIVREPRCQSGPAILKKSQPSRSKFKLVVTHFLFAIYLWGILSDVMVMTSHAFYHLSTHTIDLHFDHNHANAKHAHGHSHSKILDHALANVGKEETHKKTPSSPPPLRLSRGFEHLFQPSIALHDIQLTGHQFWLLKSSAPSEIPHEPLIPPPRNRITV